MLLNLLQLPFLFLDYVDDGVLLNDVILTDLGFRASCSNVGCDDESASVGTITLHHPMTVRAF